MALLINCVLHLLFRQIYGLLCLKKKSQIKALIKTINPVGVKSNKNDCIALDGVNLKSRISKYHLAILFMSKIGKLKFFIIK